ncbi:hypothetical protein [Cupriavidus sp. CuC1]|uniref:hypothetical protein n=1 Tax=Cupriavidus sp. CuC1 TaxID=3373131 RepID=UPI0037CF0F5A
MPPYLDYPALMALAAHSESVAQACSCCKTLSSAWESQPVSYPEEQLREAGTLRAADDESDDEPTFGEYHPDRTQFWSPAAPIAPRYFPYNRCDVWECTVCGRHFLRYVEGGGYFVDRRIRQLRASLVVDAAL